MLSRALHDLLQRMDNAARQAGRPSPRLLAASKGQTATAIAELAATLRQAAADGTTHHRPAVGENYVQEAMRKQEQLADSDLQWHLIGHLQSNKAREAATVFDWVQSLDRDKLVTALARYRPPDRPPLNVLIQVNIDDEASKHGCQPDAIPKLAAAIVAQPRLALRGLMAIPAPHSDPDRRRTAFRRMHALVEQLQAEHPQADTLSMGMSDDFELAIAEGATLVRVGTALFGPRPK